MLVIKALGAALLMVATWFMIFFLMLLADPLPANAEVTQLTSQVQCAPRGEVVAGLTGNYGEVPAAQGNTPGTLMEVYVNPDTGTWTIVVSYPDGKTCMLASGDDFSGVPNV